MRRILIGMVTISMLFGMAGAARYPGGFFSGDIDMMTYNLTNATNLDANATRLLAVENNDTSQEAAILALGINDSTHDASILGVENNDTSQEAAILALSINDTTHDADILALEGCVSHMVSIAGGVAGNFTLTGASAGDAVAGVIYLNATTGNVTELTDLTAQFSIPDTNILNQTYGGNSSLNGYLLISWVDKT